MVAVNLARSVSIPSGFRIGSAQMPTRQASSQRWTYTARRHICDGGSTSKSLSIPQAATDDEVISPSERVTIPHIIVYALGNYPYPSSRHSLPQSILPLILQRYGLSQENVTKRRENSRTIAETGVAGNAMTLIKKHDCWIGGGLIELEALHERHSKSQQTVEAQHVVPPRALLSVVKPRLLMNIAGRPLPFLLRSGNDFPHALSTTQEHAQLAIDPLPTLIVLHDSLEIPPMSLTKPRRNVGPQGHNGLRSVESSLGTRDFWRIGLGIGRPSGGKSRGDGIRDWVLGDIEADSDERLFWEGEGVAAICRALSRIALVAVKQR